MRESDQVKNSFPKSHDSQIKDSLHDEIVIWLYERLTMGPSADTELASIITRAPEEEIINIELALESPFYKKSYQAESIIGFADLKVLVTTRHIVTEDELATLLARNWTKAEVDALRIKGWRPHYFCGFVEVKSSVNIGETVRQINYYSQGYNSWTQSERHWTVCAPPFEHSKILKDQGIRVIFYAEQ